MLHDQVLSHSGAPLDAAIDDRRESPRVPFPAEVSLVWHHDFALIHRYRMVDASDGGFRIRSSIPVLEGTTGMVLRLLPKGEKIERSIMVAWCRPDASEGGYLLGLRCF